MGDGREAGALVGHTEGLTYIDSKGDGRYVISNAKDQTMKLWDLRKMMTTERFDSIRPEDYTTGFDYRFTPYDEEDYEPHPHDCSVVTFRGHKVLKTLIRCHFSPPGSTDGRYVYSGSYDGSVYIWNLDGTLAKKIDVLAATKNSRPAEDERYVDRWEASSRSTQWQTIVRDASWHPNAPVLAGKLQSSLSVLPIINADFSPSQLHHGMAGTTAWAPAQSTAGTIQMPRPRPMKTLLMTATTLKWALVLTLN